MLTSAFFYIHCITTSDLWLTIITANEIMNLNAAVFVVSGITTRSESSPNFGLPFVCTIIENMSETIVVAMIVGEVCRAWFV